MIELRNIYSNCFFPISGSPCSESMVPPFRLCDFHIFFFLTNDSILLVRGPLDTIDMAH